MNEWFQNLGNTLGAYLPNLLVALIILIIGWLVALLISRLVESLLKRTTLDQRVASMLKGGTVESLPVERWIGTGVFWLIMLFVIIAFLNQLNLAVVAGPLNNFLDQVILFLPRLLGAAVLILIAWLIASVLRLLIVRLVNASGLAKRVSDSAEMGVDQRTQTTIGETIGNVVYWLVFLLFLPAILEALSLEGILAPVQSMVNDILGVLPNILGAGLVLLIGWLVARIIRQIVTNLLASVGIDRVFERAGVTAGTGGQRLSNIIGTIVFVLVLIPVAIAALNVLNIPAISVPASNMLQNFLNALPNIFAAFLLLAIAYFIARMVGRFVANILESLGFDRIFTALGLPDMRGPRRPGTVYVSGETTSPGAEAAAAMPIRTTPSQIVGYLVTLGIVLFAVIEAANLLGFEILATLVSQFVVSLVNILFGLIIFGLGLYLANIAYRVISTTRAPQAGLLATAARIAIIIFAGALALREMGIAASIVNLAFGLLLGAIAVAVAIAFGLGGREEAAQVLSNWRREIKSGSPVVPVTGGSEPDLSNPTPPNPNPPDVNL